MLAFEGRLDYLTPKGKSVYDSMPFIYLAFDTL